MAQNSLQRIMKYCAVAEKSTHDVLAKLTEWGIPEEEHDVILKRLHDEKFIDDCRYAKSFVSDKWGLDKWGRIKIENALINKNINAEIISGAIGQIDDQEYLSELHEMLRKKWKEVKSESNADDAKRISMYALSRGFEEELITEWIDKHIFS